MFRLFKTRRWAASALSLYGAAVHQARRPEFYTRLGVADTVDGRFDMIALHVALIIRRLSLIGGEAEDLAQALFDAMFKDMDRSLREMGVGDLSVGKHIKGMAKAFYGRAGAYEEGLAEGRAVLEAGLRRNLYRKTEPSDAQVAAMAAYVETQAAALERQDLTQLIAAPAFTDVPEAPVAAPAQPSAEKGEDA